MARLDDIFRAWRRHLWGWRFWFGLLGGLAIALGIQWSSYGLSSDLLTRLPQAQIHPLPEVLQGTPDPTTATEDYFGAVTPSPLGHLIWSEFPVKVYVAPLDPTVSPAAQQRQQQWQRATLAAIAQWQAYIPLLTRNNRDCGYHHSAASSPNSKGDRPRNGRNSLFPGPQCRNSLRILYR